MPVENTIKERCDKLREKLSPAYLFENTSLFKGIDPSKREEVQQKYVLYFDSWIKEELDQLLKK